MRRKKRKKNKDTPVEPDNCITGHNELHLLESKEVKLPSHFTANYRSNEELMFLKLFLHRESVNLLSR